MKRLSRKQKLNQGHLLIRGCALAAAFGLAACGGSGGGSGGNTANGTILGTVFNPEAAIWEQAAEGGGYGSSVEISDFASLCSAYQGTGSYPGSAGFLDFTWQTAGIPAVGTYTADYENPQSATIAVTFSVIGLISAYANGTVTVTSSSASMIEGTYNLTFYDSSGDQPTNLSGSFSAPACGAP